MSRLESLVLIAGKNGAGKTRILDKIFSVFSQKPTRAAIEQSLINQKNHERDIQYYQSQIALIENQIKSVTNDTQQIELQESIENHEKEIGRLNIAIKNCNAIQKWCLIKTNTEAEIYMHIPFVPKSLAIADSNTFSKADLINNAISVTAVGVSTLPQGAFAKIQVIQDVRFNTSHPESDTSEEEKKKANDDYDRLKETIFVFLGTDISRTINGEATLFGFPLGQSKLSDGQKILLQLCIAIYSQEVALNELILVLDEPENHLHPSVIIETIEKIQKCVSNGQIWIATHSVPLLAHFGTSDLWYIESGKEITYAGKTPETVLRSLLGNEEEIAKLQDFISLPAQFATSKYAFESLLEPLATMTSFNDPQSRQIKNELLSLTTTGKIRVLDYGAGKGRLISNISDLDVENQNKIIKNLDYIAYDKYDRDKALCEESIKRVFGTSDKKYYNDFDALFSEFDKESFDIVIMCNVLHEVDPKDWLKLFQKDGEISSLLKKTGILVLVEDCQMPVGEMAYQNGFLVLDTSHLKDLFCIKEQDTGFTHSVSPENARLKIHQIPKNLLVRITAGSRIKAIESVSTTAKTNILDIRKKDKDYKNGIFHGFWTQQFANAQLDLAELVGKM